MTRRIQILAAMLLLADMAGAATISVRKDGTGDYMVLQQALDVAASGDTVLVGPGEYTESSMVRLDGYGYDIESFGFFRATNVTLLGSGMDVTFIGPISFEGNAGTLSPKCMVQDIGGGWLRVGKLTLRNCFEGLYVDGVLFMDQCRLASNRTGVVWNNVGSGGKIENSVVDGATSSGAAAAFDIGALAGGSNLVIGNCSFDSYGVVRGVQGIAFLDCDLDGLDLYAGTVASLDRCSGTYLGMYLGAGSYCAVRDSELGHADGAMWIDQSAPGGRFVVENSRLAGGLHGVLYSGDGAGPCAIHNCDLVKGSGPMVECAFSATQVTHDLSNNYWGTTSESDIQGWIYDHTDNPGRGATVIYSPFSGQSVPTESTTWGELKALFR